MKEKIQEAVGRRGFFGSAGKTVALGVGAALTATTGAKAATEVPEGDGYRETPHVMAYYESAKF